LLIILSYHQPIIKQKGRNRHAVIARQIGFGTRTPEGSLAYSCLLSVIETCRLREINPWTYIASVLANARQGLSPPTFPVGS
jgi:transposase